MMLKGNGFTLRPWREGDEESLVNNANNRMVWKNMTDEFPHPYRLKDAKAWIKRANKKGKLQFAIVIDGKAVGGVGVDIGRGRHRKTAMFGYWLGQEYWGKGIMSKASRLVVDYCFKKYHIARMEAKVYTWNPASRRVLEKNGFKMEGLLRNNSMKAKKVVDEWIFSKIKNE